MDGITLALALLGAALGVINTLWVIFRDTVRIRVVPIWMTGGGTIIGKTNTHGFLRFSSRETAVSKHPDGQIGLRIINKGFTEITITEAGWSRSSWFERNFKRKRLVSPILADAEEQTVLPIRMAPRSAIVIWQRGRGAAVDGSIRGKFCGYASTACGITVFGSSGAFRAARDRAIANA